MCTRSARTGRRGSDDPALPPHSGGNPGLSPAHAEAEASRARRAERRTWVYLPGLGVVQTLNPGRCVKSGHSPGARVSSGAVLTSHGTRQSSQAAADKHRELLEPSEALLVL